jgi:hypothetical protein
MTKRVQRRPRLEQRQGYDIKGEILTPEGQTPYVILHGRNGQYVSATLKDTKRAHAFLGKAIAYLEPKRKGGG